MNTDYGVSIAFTRDPTCAGCDADGFRRVGPGYVLAIAPGDLDAEHANLTRMAAQVGSGLVTLAEFEAASAAYTRLAYKQDAAADSVFPCPTCKPEQYRRWRNGCFTPNHNRRKCDLCGPKKR